MTRLQKRGVQITETKGTSDLVSSTRSVGMNLARPFKAGTGTLDGVVALRRLNSRANFR